MRHRVRRDTVAVMDPERLAVDLWHCSGRREALHGEAPIGGERRQQARVDRRLLQHRHRKRPDLGATARGRHGDGLRIGTQQQCRCAFARVGNHRADASQHVAAGIQQCQRGRAGGKQQRAVRQRQHVGETLVADRQRLHRPEPATVEPIERRWPAAAVLAVEEKRAAVTRPGDTAQPRLLRVRHLAQSGQVERRHLEHHGQWLVDHAQRKQLAIGRKPHPAEQFRDPHRLACHQRMARVIQPHRPVAGTRSQHALRRVVQEADRVLVLGIAGHRFPGGRVQHLNALRPRLAHRQKAAIG